MSVLSAIPIVGPVIDLATGWLNQKGEQSKAKHEMQLEAIKAGADERANGWKDEFALLVITAPFIACFIPGAADYIRAGFETLKTATPEWYQYLFTGGIAAAMGISQYVKTKK